MWRFWRNFYRKKDNSSNVDKIRWNVNRISKWNKIWELRALTVCVSTESHQPTESTRVNTQYLPPAAAFYATSPPPPSYLLLLFWSQTLSIVNSIVSWLLGQWACFSLLLWFVWRDYCNSCLVELWLTINSISHVTARVTRNNAHF
jgi:hypothetical protein